MRDYEQFKAELLKNKKLKKLYDDLGPEFALVEMIIRKRIEKGFTQAQLARKIGTKQSAISRLESGNYNPTLEVLKKVADALGSKIEISLR